MTRRASPKLVAYASLGSSAVLVGISLGLPELVAVGAPLLLVVLCGIATTTQPHPHVVVELQKRRLIEGDEVGVCVTAFCERTVSLDLFVVLPGGASVVDGENPVSVRLPAGVTIELQQVVRFQRWGSFSLGRTVLRVRGSFGLFFFEGGTSDVADVKVYPSRRRVSALIAPRETQVFSGNRLSSRRGEGIEFADIRPFVAGDERRRINWRLTAKRQEFWITDSHTDRNSDIVIFLDSFSDVASEERSSLDDAVRGIASLTAEYLRFRDRVGLVSFGAGLTWLTPSGGLRHAYRVVDAILGTKVEFSAAWRNVGVVPPGTLPPKSLIVAFSPLVDERAVTALLELRSRGFDVSIVELPAEEYLSPGTTEVESVAHRIWTLERDLLRARFARRGVAVVPWNGEGPLDVAMQKAQTYRRRAMQG